MTEGFDDPDAEIAALVASVADDFRARRVRGENPDINVYASEYPHAAEQIRGVLGLLQLVDPTRTRRTFALEDMASGTLGDFRVGREVGRGGMGVVYEATQISLGRRVALKVLPFASLVDARMLQRFQNEARAAAALDHPHIVKVHAVGQERGVHFIAMQFIDGRPLSDTIRELHGSASPNLSSRTAIVNASPDAASTTSVVDAVVSTLPDTRSTRFFHWAAELGAKAADALEHAHSLGVVHRDVKPANLLIDAQGAPWISDFGLAKITSTDAGVTMTGDVFGTLRYMSPEQALAKHGLVDHRTDVYALGATLYELLVGRPVVGGTDKAEILRKIIDEEPVAPRRVNRAIPLDLETIVLKCLRMEPNDRYASAKEMADDLRRFLAGAPVVARPVPLLEHGAKWAKRRPGTVLAFLTALCLIVAGLWMYVEMNARRQAELRERQQRYAAHIRWAQSANDEHKNERSLEILETQRPLPGHSELRGFEWYFLKRLCNQENWQALLDNEPWSVLGHPSTVVWSQFSPDGDSVFSCSANERGHVNIWDVHSGRKALLPVAEKGLVFAAKLSPDGKTLALVYNHWVEMRDLATNRAWPMRTIEFRGEELETPAFSPDSQRIAIIARNADKAVICDVVSGKELVRLRDAPALLTAAFSPDGRTLLTTSWLSSQVHLWDTTTGTRLWQLDNDRYRTTYPTFTEDGKVVALPSDCGTLNLRLTSSGNLIETFPHPNGRHSVAFSLDERRLATCGRDKTVWFWDRKPKESRNRLELPDNLGEVEFSRNGRLLQVSCGNTVRIWSLSNMHEGEVWSVAFAPDGKTLASAGDDHLIRLWDPATSKQISELKGHGSLVSCIAYSPNGKLLASGGYDKTVRLWDPTTGVELAKLRGHNDHLRCVAFSPDGKLLASGSKEHNVRIWDVSRRELLRTLDGHTDGMRSVTFTPDGRRLATASRDRTVRIWDSKTGQIVKVLTDANSVWGLAFSPDGKSIATGDDEGIVKIWDVVSGEEQMLLAGHRGEVRSVAFSTDGLRVASAGQDHTIRLWDLATGTELLVLKGHAGPVNGVAFAPDGTSLASAGHDGVVKFWRAPRE